MQMCMHMEYIIYIEEFNLFLTQQEVGASFQCQIYIFLNGYRIATHLTNPLLVDIQVISCFSLLKTVM